MEQPKLPSAAFPPTTPPPPPPPPPPSSSSASTEVSKQVGNDSKRIKNSNPNGGGTTRKKPSSPPPPPPPPPHTPEELVAHYEAQGLDNKEACMRVIQELRGLLFQTAASGSKKKERFMADTIRKLDNVNTRLAIVETKLDTKPGFPEAMAIGVATGSAVSAVLGVCCQIWGAVKVATTTTNDPNSSSSP